MSRHTPRFSRVYAEIHPDNESSIKLFERASYHQTDIERCKWGGQMVNALFFELKPEQFDGLP
jgi:RimJ/RimL family protein N-acetyltransferase